MEQLERSLGLIGGSQFRYGTKDIQQRGVPQNENSKEEIEILGWFQLEDSHGVSEEGDADKHHTLEEGHVLAGHQLYEVLEDDWSDGDEDDVGQDAEHTDLKELVEEESVVEPVSHVDENWQPDVVENVVGEGQIHKDLVLLLVVEHLKLEKRRTYQSDVATS